NFQNAGFPLVTLSNYDVLVEEAIKLDYISDTQLVTLQDWRVNPSTWGV
ncbi:MAG: Orotate phosphoribosyltransferase, partial [Bacteroidota bacterium]